MIKRNDGLRFLAIVLGLIIGFYPSAALATTYTNGVTTLVLTETQNNQNVQPTGFYFTRATGRDWLGRINIASYQGGVGSYRYEGTFQDRTLGPGAQLTCTGDIRITRAFIGRSNRLGAIAFWNITGGEGCPSVGQQPSLQLEEPLPHPDDQGEFNAQNANTYMSETNGTVTWPQWRLAAGINQLNCRATPNGEILKVYQSNANRVDLINAETRGGNAFATSDNGGSWVLTRDRCYVRANSRYIEPVSLPG
ncbi:MAG: hypothetical protein MUF49_19905 [Oculatellaceae cyanobacterium Prado106]|jgi:hypothetical protein|nr:hypothetical protein [Oculatellaceae cyanobacterium Prado106]